jgi:hypothetical protein
MPIDVRRREGTSSTAGAEREPWDTSATRRKSEHSCRNPAAATPKWALELLYDDFSSHNINRAFPVRHLPGKVGVLRAAGRFPESKRVRRTAWAHASFSLRSEVPRRSGTVCPFNVYGNRIWSSGTLPSSFATASGLHAAREFSFQTNCTKVNIIMSRGRHTARHSSAAARQRI